jgi:glucose/arabinose dehydrogenase
MLTIASRPRLSRRSLALILVTLTALVWTPLTVSGATFTIALSRRLPTHLFAAPTQVTSAGDGTNRLFVVERRGTVKDGVLQSGFFLDIRPAVLDGGERGLLGLAFHPNFETNRRLFAFYTNNGGDIVISRYIANVARTRVSADTGRRLLVIEHSAKSNHNGGSIAFGPDGYLYFGVGDGGGAGDPENDAQNRVRNFLGKILRINVNGTGAGPYGRYSVPASNPFAGAIRGLNEIWAYGLRNPWRISFDRADGRLFIADVGQSRNEEINREPASSPGGANYGWNIMEGRSCYDPSRCPLAGDVLPVAQYTHANGNCSITGGFVYRGAAYPVMVGEYVFADFCSGRIWSMPAGGGTASMVLRVDTAQRISSFGEDENGELYAVTIDGKLYRVVARA